MYAHRTQSSMKKFHSNNIGRKKHLSSGEPTIIILIIVATLFLIWIFETKVRLALLDSTNGLACFQCYMAGLFFPEKLYIDAVWNPSLDRPQHPGTGKIITLAKNEVNILQDYHLHLQVAQSHH